VEQLDQPDACAGSCRGCERVGSCADRVVCRCLGVTEDMVVHAIVTLGLRTLTELRSVTEAGDGCTCCHRELKEYLAIYSSRVSSSDSMCSAK
jgi:bacterioferritin-associated ferredoxin